MTQIILGPQIARGGEGRIHEVNTPPDCLAKIYHKPVEDTHRRKLEAMVRIRTSHLDAVAAWPRAVLTQGGACIGFVMPRITGAGIIDKLMHPEERRVTFPTVDYGFLLHVSMNLMRAASTLHAAGCVIGDVNESNVYIQIDGTVRFIDVDSFQLTHAGEQFRCTVGKPLYTPPELQGAAFRDVARTTLHDSFGLAVLVFQMLMQGRHPYAGVRCDGRGHTIEDAIREGLYAHSSKLANRVKAPPECLPVSTLGDLAAMFEQSFLGSSRPTAADWMAALDRTRRELRPCSRNPRHRYISSCGACPLCALPHDPLPGPDVGHAPPVDASGEPLAALMREAEQLPGLHEIETRCQALGISAQERTWRSPTQTTPTTTATNTRSSSGVVPLAILGMVLMFGGFISLCFVPPGLAMLAMVVGIVLFYGAGMLEDALHTRTNSPSPPPAPTSAPAKFTGAMQNLELIEARAAALNRAAGQELASLAETVTTALEAVRHSSGAQRRAMPRPSRDGLVRFLTSQPIRQAVLQGVPMWQRDLLADCGIRSAADVDWGEVRALSDSDSLADALMQWRRDLEARYMSSQMGWPNTPDASATKTRLQVALNHYRLRYSALDSSLSACALELDSARRQLRAILQRCGGP